MLRFLTAGESHGKGLVAVLEGLPAGLKIKEEDINIELARRQKGYGRSARMKIESDAAQIISGVRWGQTIGSPVLLFIKNRDWENWKTIMSLEEKDKSEQFHLKNPRPGHADLPGALKYFREDMRDLQERASARETAARAAVGAVCKKFLSEFGILIYSAVDGIGGVAHRITEQEVVKEYEKIENSSVRCPEPGKEKEMIDKINAAANAGDTVGGTFVVVITGCPPGLGSHVQWDRKLNANLARSVMSIQAVKGVEIGRGFGYAGLQGREVHDRIYYSESRGFYRKTNNAGGIEGGMTNGEPVVLRAVMKPIPSLMQPLQTVDIKTKSEVTADIVRSDVCAVPACAVVAESAAAFEIAAALLEKFGGDSVEETRRNHGNYMEYVRNF
jgi:chorismate synthase